MSKPFRELRLSHLSGSQRTHGAYGILLRRIETKTVAFQKDSRERQGHPFVAVGEWMISGNGPCISCREADEVGLPVGKLIAWCGECRVQQAFIPESGCTAVLREQLAVDRQSKLPGDPPRFTLHFARSRSAFLYRFMKLSATSIDSAKSGS